MDAILAIMEMPLDRRFFDAIQPVFPVIFKVVPNVETIRFHDPPADAPSYLEPLVFDTSLKEHQPCQPSL
jgi:hypothetical protein